MSDPLCICGCPRSFHASPVKDNVAWGVFRACSGKRPRRSAASDRALARGVNLGDLPCKCKGFRLALYQHEPPGDAELER